MTIQLCRIHNIDFGAEDQVEAWRVNCPLCVEKELAILKTELAHVTKHRDILLQAIEIKQTTHVKKS